MPCFPSNSSQNKYPNSHIRSKFKKHLTLKLNRQYVFDVDRDEPNKPKFCCKRGCKVVEISIELPCAPGWLQLRVEEIRLTILWYLPYRILHYFWKELRCSTETEFWKTIFFQVYQFGRYKSNILSSNRNQKMYNKLLTFTVTQWEKN